MKNDHLKKCEELFRDQPVSTNEYILFFAPQMHSEQRVRNAQLRVRRIHEVARQVSAEEGYLRRDGELSHESESSSIQKLDGS